MEILFDRDSIAMPASLAGKQVPVDLDALVAESVWEPRSAELYALADYLYFEMRNSIGVADDPRTLPASGETIEPELKELFEKLRRDAIIRAYDVIVRGARLERPLWLERAAADVRHQTFAHDFGLAEKVRLEVDYTGTPGAHATADGRITVGAKLRAFLFVFDAMVVRAAALVRELGSEALPMLGAMFSEMLLPYCLQTETGSPLYRLPVFVLRTKTAFARVSGLVRLQLTYVVLHEMAHIANPDHFQDATGEKMLADEYEADLFACDALRAGKAGPGEAALAVELLFAFLTCIEDTAVARRRLAAAPVSAVAAHRSRHAFLRSRTALSAELAPEGTNLVRCARALRTAYEDRLRALTGDGLSAEIAFRKDSGYGRFDLFDH